MAQPGHLPAWWQVMLPHPDIRSSKRLDESIFAADLGQVVRGAAAYDYQDPVRFFAGTFLSSGLSALLSDVLRELAGRGSGNRIIQIETPFGGGKTHTLLALYHLINAADALRTRPEIGRLLKDAELSEIPSARVATIAGTDLSAIEPALQPDGTIIHTLWGQIAYQLGGSEGYERLRRADELKAAPGATALRDLFALVPPRLILMDELVTYIVAAARVELGGTTLKDQTITFLQQLTQAVAQTPHTMLLLTIPGSKTELYGQAAREMQQDVFEVANQTADVVGRIQTMRTPVQGDDIYEVLRRRLLEPLSGKAAYDERDAKARQVATTYVAMYRAIPNDVPQEVQEAAYIDRMVRAYPFHPDVVRLLYERWGTLPDFQRTRGALRILGMVLADLFAANSHDPLILPCHINLAPGDLRNELVRVLENTAFNNVLDSDAAGSGSKALQIDNSLGREHARFHPAIRTAATIFMWSFSGATSETRGASEAQIRVGVLTPEMQPAIIGNVLSEFRRQLWYLHEEANTYRFDTRANLNRVIVQKEEGITAQVAHKLVETTITEMVSESASAAKGKGTLFGTGTAPTAAPSNARTFLFPHTSQEVADIPTIGIVLLRPAQHAPAGESTDDLPPIVRDILHQYGERPRENRNALIVLVPDSTLVSEAEKAARRRLALQAAMSDSQLALPENQHNELKHLLQDTTNAFPQEVARIYQSVVIPAGTEKNGMERFNLGTRSAIKGSTLWDDAFTFLAAKWYYLDSLAPSLLASDHFGIWPQGAAYLSTQKLWESFLQFPHLPILAGSHVLIDAISKGCDDGILGYAVGDTNGPGTADQGRFGHHNPRIKVEIAPTTWVLQADYARTHLLPSHDPVREIPPELLTDPAIWPTGSGRRKLTDIWAAVVNHYAPRPVAGPHVLNAALHSAIASSLLRISVEGSEPTPDAALPGPERVAQLVGIELVRPETKPDQRPRLLTIDVKNVEMGQLSKITTGVIMPLKTQGAKVTLRLVIDADNPAGIDPTVLELTIKETFKQLGLTPDYTQSG